MAEKGCLNPGDLITVSTNEVLWPCDPASSMDMALRITLFVTRVKDTRVYLGEPVVLCDLIPSTNGTYHMKVLHPEYGCKLFLSARAQKVVTCE